MNLYTKCDGSDERMLISPSSGMVLMHDGEVFAGEVEVQSLDGWTEEPQKNVVQVVADIGMKVVEGPGDKLGSTVKKYLFNNVLVRTDYIQAENVPGTAENPIQWGIDLVLHPNYYYTFGGVRKVWMGSDGVTAEWDDINFVEF